TDGLPDAIEPVGTTRTAIAPATHVTGGLADAALPGMRTRQSYTTAVPVVTSWSARLRRLTSTVSSAISGKVTKRRLRTSAAAAPTGPPAAVTTRRPTTLCPGVRPEPDHATAQYTTARSHTSTPVSAGSGRASSTEWRAT